MKTKIFKQEAKKSLKGKFKKSLLMVLVFFITQLLTSLLIGWLMFKTQYDLILAAISIIIMPTLGYGLIASFIRLKREEKVNCFSTLYYGIRDLDKVWKVLGKYIFKMLIIIIPLILCAYLLFIQIVSFAIGYGMDISFFVGLFGTITFGILLITQMLYYSLNNYILYDYNDLKAKEVLKKSKELMKYNRWNLFKLGLSFTGWYFLAIAISAVIIVGIFLIFKINNYALVYITYIPLIFLFPYQYTTLICFYESLKGANEKETREKIKNKKSKKK